MCVHEEAEMWRKSATLRLLWCVWDSMKGSTNRSTRCDNSKESSVTESITPRQQGRLHEVHVPDNLFEVSCPGIS